MLSNIGSGEIIVVLLVLLFLFGGKKLPELARGLGESGKELKKAKKEIETALAEIDREVTIDDQKPPVSTPPESAPVVSTPVVEVAEPILSDTSSNITNEVEQEVIPSQEGNKEGGEIGNA